MAQEFSETEYPAIRYFIGDVFNIEFLTTALLDGNYSVVINCIGILNQDAEKNPSKAIYLNAYLPHQIANILRDTNTKLVHLSTDCVFAGNTGPYFESSFCDGKSFYDRSKSLGEVNDKKNLTFRNSIIGPDINQNGIGLFNWYMKQNGIVSGYGGAIWTGVTTLTLAKAIEKTLDQNITGLYHLVNNENISKLELLRLFNKYFINKNVTIVEASTIQLDKSLLSTRTDLNFIIPSYEHMIEEMKDWVLSHSDLYKHYFI